VAGNGDNSSSVRALDGANGEILWTTNSGAGNWHMSVYPDIDGDGIDEPLIGSWQTQGARLLNGATGAVRWTHNTASTQVMRVVAMSDANGDGVPDVAAAGSSGGARVISGADGDAIWSTNVGALVWAIDPVPDVTGDGVDEVAFGDFNGITHLVDGTDGTELWTHDTSGHKVMALRGAPDLDGDGHGEVVIGAQQLSSAIQPMLFVVDADSGLPSGAPELTPSGAQTLGTTLPLLLTGATPGHTAFTLVGPDPSLLPLFGKGTLAIDPGFYFILLTQTVPVTGTIETPLDVPATPAWAGLSFHMQSFVLTGSPAVGVSSNRTGLLLQL
jgi:outer membrane protein assembly factor BamB